MQNSSRAGIPHSLPPISAKNDVAIPIPKDDISTEKMVEFLLDRGADAQIKDTKVGGTPAGWAEYGGHPEVKRYLENIVRG